jgi:hypothetical protein
MYPQNSPIYSSCKMPEFFEMSPLSGVGKHSDFQGTAWSSRRNIALSFRHALRVDRRLPELRKKLVFSVCRLLSRRCHIISSIYQSYSCPSQNRTSGFPIHTAPGWSFSMPPSYDRDSGLCGCSRSASRHRPEPDEKMARCMPYAGSYG